MRADAVGAEPAGGSGAAPAGSSSPAVDLARVVDRLKRAGVLPADVEVMVSRLAVPADDASAGAGQAEQAGQAEMGVRARKVSVSMPEDLLNAVQRRVGRGAFSQYVSEAVAHRLGHDLLAELLAMLDDEHGPVPGHMLEQARREWPDAR
jgi:hypothetical protein